MSEQVIGDGANIFIIIVAVIVGFAAAMSYIDVLKVKEEEKEQKNHH